MGQKKKWSAASKFEIALKAIKNESTLTEICKVDPIVKHS